MISFRKSGLVIYLTCGDPAVAVTRDVALVALNAGADVIELGVPFSDPVADGPIIQRASERALANNTTLADVLHLGADLRKLRPKAGLMVFSYLNPVLRFGMERFAAECHRAGIDGALITDLTVEEAGDYLRLMRARDLATVFLAAPTSTDQRLKAICKASTGFVYAVSRTGVTGVSTDDLKGEARKLVKRIKKHAKVPVAVGFGIATAQQFREVAAFADAAVVGSAIMKLIEEAGAQRAAQAVADWIKSLKAIG